MGREDEAYMPPELVQRVLESAPPEVILIGGQALAFWMDYYGIHDTGGAPAVSRDVDFFTRDAANAEPLSRFARAIGGRPAVRDLHALSALIGSAVAPAREEGRVYNVDLLHDVVGLDRAHVEANAVTLTMAETGTTLRVMHPLDVLQSRNMNLHVLAGKQDDVGRSQFRLAIEMARAHLEAGIDAIEGDDAQGAESAQRAIFDLIGEVVAYAREDAARRNAQRHGLWLADAIPAWRIAPQVFWHKQWPHLRKRMSPAYAALCDARAARAGQ